MPHSVSPEDPSLLHHNMPIEADLENGEFQTTEAILAQETTENNSNTQESETTDQDMTMVDVEIEGKPVLEVSIKEEIKSEVKLEDLFADMDSDDEFNSSTGQDFKISSSPPEATASPVYVSALVFQGLLLTF